MTYQLFRYLLYSQLQSTQKQSFHTFDQLSTQHVFSLEVVLLNWSKQVVVLVQLEGLIFSIDQFRMRILASFNYFFVKAWPQTVSFYQLLNCNHFKLESFVVFISVVHSKWLSACFLQYSIQLPQELFDSPISLDFSKSVRDDLSQFLYQKVVTQLRDLVSGKSIMTSELRAFQVIISSTSRLVDLECFYQAKAAI